MDVAHSSVRDYPSRAWPRWDRPSLGQSFPAYARLEMAMVGAQAAIAVGLVAHEADKLFVREGRWYHGLPLFCLG